MKHKPLIYKYAELIVINIVWLALSFYAAIRYYDFYYEFPLMFIGISCGILTLIELIQLIRKTPRSL